MASRISSKSPFFTFWPGLDKNFKNCSGYKAQNHSGISRLIVNPVFKFFADPGLIKTVIDIQESQLFILCS